MTSSVSQPHVVIAGGGPAGLTAAYHLTDNGVNPLVFEGSSAVGGIARTESYKGYRFDIGGHRFFTKVTQVQKLWEEVCGGDFIDVPRMSRIFYKGKFYHYPLKIGNTLANLGAWESVRILASYAKWKVRPSQLEDTFEDWVRNRFGGRLYWHFFRTYTEKVWGIPCTEIRADWAAQRIKNLSFQKAVWDALTNRNDTTSLIKTFKYPRLGPGMMWEKFRDRVEQRGGEVRMNTRVTGVEIRDNRVTAVDLTTNDGTETVHPDHFLSTMALPSLIKQIRPAPPAEVLQAADRLKYRDFLIVTLILSQPDPFPDNWIYIHSPEVKVGRIQNFRSWSREMVPDENTSSIGMEYFCHRGDDLWDSDDKDLIAQAGRELEQLGLGKQEDVVDSVVIRQPKAYPVYDAEYKANVDIIRQYVQSIENLHVAGRNGMHRYNNQDHSMLTALLSARNILGEDHDVWNVNVERSYHEDFVVDKTTKTAGQTEEDSVAEAVDRSEDREETLVAAGADSGTSR